MPVIYLVDERPIQTPIGPQSRRSIDETSIAFSRWFADQRKARGLTLMEASGLIGISDATLTRIENTQSSITVKTAAQIVSALGAGFSDLYTQNILGFDDASSLPKWINKEPVPPQDFSTTIHNARLKKGYSFAGLEKISGLSHITLRKYERTFPAKLKLHSVVQLDQALELDGRLIAAAWRDSLLGE